MAIFRSNPSVGTEARSFANILRSLLVRIRACEISRSGKNWPPSAWAGGDLYRARPTMWGVESADTPAEKKLPTTDTATSHPREPTPIQRRPIEIPVFRLPVPRGLPAT